ncbi:MAG: molybdate ABC transporter substrate-binding protein [Thermomicrobiales bacterium]|nr:molybdate ABC transporter substrate-binding protein [Thermomicrobiales bacterium]
MRETRRRAFVLFGVLLLAMILAACGGDDADPTSTTAPAATTVPATATIAAAATVAPTEAPTEALAEPTAEATVAEATATTAAPTATTAAPTATTEPPAAALTGKLTVFAAASLTDAFTQIGDSLKADNPDLEIEFNFAGSQALVTQLGQGAHAEVFASADTKQMGAAQDESVIANDPVIFTHNRLTIIVPADNPGGIQTPADLAKSGLKIVFANEEVPVGRYTGQVLDLMSADPAFGADFRSQVEANIVSLEENVKQVVTKVQLGEADAGIVYSSDVTPAVRDDVATIDIPDDLNVIAEYPIALVVDGDATLGQAFIDAVLSEAGQQALADNGFR